MLLTEAPKLVINNKIRLEGGWMMRVPDVQVDRSELQTLKTNLMRLGYPSLLAEDITTKSVQSLFNSAWQRSVMNFMRYTIKLYVKSFGSTEGFDPEYMQSFYVPQANRIWRGRGNPLIREAFKAMRDEG